MWLAADVPSYYVINFHQRLRRQGYKLDELMVLLDAAKHIFSLVGDSLLYWSPEHFPII